MSELFTEHLLQLAASVGQSFGRGTNGYPSVQGWAKEEGAKFIEFSLNFPGLPDWLYIGLLCCLAALEREFSKMKHFFFYHPVIHCCLQ